MKIDAFDRITQPVTEFNRPYFDGLAAHELRLQCCPHDQTYRFPAGPVCPVCLADDAEWVAVSGRARLWSWIRMHQKYFEAFDDERPYLVAFVELAEGPTMISTVIGTDPVDLMIDAELELDFRAVGEHTLPVFRVVEQP